jgi:hypothetical protein
MPSVCQGRVHTAQVPNCQVTGLHQEGHFAKDHKTVPEDSARLILKLLLFNLVDLSFKCQQSLALT